MLLGLLAASLTVLSTAAYAAEKKIKKSEVPKAVIEAVEAKYPKAKLKSFEQEDEDGKTLYEIKITVGRDSIEVKVSPEGTILAEERVITMKELPEAVKKSLTTSKYAKAKVRKIEKVTETDKPDEVAYEIHVDHAGKRLELVFSQTGELKKEVAKDEKKDGKKIRDND
jgi:hypothetical protein